MGGRRDGDPTSKIVLYLFEGSYARRNYTYPRRQLHVQKNKRTKKESRDRDSAEQKQTFSDRETGVFASLRLWRLAGALAVGDATVSRYFHYRQSI